VRPQWVQFLDDYWRWIEQLIEGSGAELSNAYLAVQIVEDHPGSGNPDALMVEQQRLTYPDGSYLEFDLSIGSDLDSIDYSFHYARANNAVVWRLDKHIGHEDEDGVDTHIHVGPDERRTPHDEVDLADVLDRVRADQSGGTVR
jgi:hypothetical protein